MYPAMERAYEILVATPAKLKHVIILTDGISAPGDFVGIAATMQSARITVLDRRRRRAMPTTTLLEEIARTGQGRYYVTDDPAAIPQIFAKETVTASKSAIDEQPFVPQVVRATQTFADLDLEDAPFLLGYVMTRPKPTCEVILASEKGDPLLVWWRYGLGMTVAFTSDAKSPLGGRVAHLAGLFASSGRSSCGTRCARATPRAWPSRSRSRAAGRRSRSTPSTPPAGSSTRPRRK